MAEKAQKGPATEKGTGFLFWGLIVVTVVNLAMVIVALALFAP
jgi:hypothetical protein